MIIGMKNIIVNLLFLFVLTLFNCTPKTSKPTSNCPFRYLETSYTKEKIIEGYKNNLRFLISLKIPEKKVKIGDAEITLSDSLLNYDELEWQLEKGVKYSQEDIIEFNKGINLLCIKFHLLNEMDSTMKSQKLIELYDLADKYLIYGNPVIKIDTIIRHKVLNVDSRSPTQKKGDLNIRVNEAKNLNVINEPKGDIIINNK